MAENVNVSAPSAGTHVIATDEVTINSATVHVQRMKLVASADGSGEELSKAEDAAHASGNHGIPAAVVRKDAFASLCGADGDYTFLQVDAVGRLHTAPNGLSTDKVESGTASLVPKFVSLSAAASGNNTLLAAVASKKIRVLGGVLVSTGAVTVQFQSGAGGTNLTGVMSLPATGILPLAFNPLGHFETAVNTLLNLSLGGAVQVSGYLVYVEV